MWRNLVLLLFCGAALFSARAAADTGLTTGTVPVAGGDIYYEAKGSGAPVILLHAGLVDCRMWDAQFDLLARDFRVIRFDARGAGRSSVPSGDYSNYEDLHAVMTALGVKSATLVGLSLGGRTAIDFALAHPDMVDAIVAVAPGMSGWAFKDPVLVERAKIAQAAVDANDPALWVDWFVRSWVDGPKRTPEQVDKAVRDRVAAMATHTMAKYASLVDYRQRSGRVQEAGAAKRLSELKVRILTIVGDQDMSDIHNIVDALVAAVPGATKVVVAGAGHMVNMEKPEEFNRELRAFLQGSDR